MAGPWAFRIQPVPLPPGAAEDEDYHWQDYGLCAEIGDDNLWFPPKGGSTVQAKLICDACPVREPCLEFALTDEAASRFGIWAGTSARDRRNIRRQRARQRRREERAA